MVKVAFKDYRLFNLNIVYIYSASCGIQNQLSLLYRIVCLNLRREILSQKWIPVDDLKPITQYLKVRGIEDT